MWGNITNNERGGGGGVEIVHIKVLRLTYFILNLCLDPSFFLSGYTSVTTASEHCRVSASCWIVYINKNETFIRDRLHGDGHRTFFLELGPLWVHSAHNLTFLMHINDTLKYICSPHMYCLRNVKISGTLVQW